MLSQKNTNCYSLTRYTWKISPHYLVKCKTFSSDRRYVAFHHAVWNSAHVATRRLQNSSVSRIGTRYMRCCESYNIQTRLYQAHLHWAWSKNQRQYYWEAATSDPQHWWRHVCLPARQCARTSCSWQSRASAPWDTPSSSVLTCGQPTVLTSTQSITASGACCKSACIEYQSAIRTSCGSVLLWHGLNFSRAWWTMQLISGEKDWKHVSVQKMVNLNTCCDVACLTFQFSHITTGSLQSHQCLEERNSTCSQMKKFCILQVRAVTFFRCGG